MVTGDNFYTSLDYINCIVLNEGTNVLVLFSDNYIAKIHYCFFNAIKSHSQGNSLIRTQVI